MVPFASYVSRGQSKPYKRINGPIVGMLLFFQLICMICGREGHGAECMVRAQKLHSEQRSFCYLDCIPGYPAQTEKPLGTDSHRTISKRSTEC